MARVEFFANTRVFGYANLQDYEIVSADARRVTMVFDDDRAAFDADTHPWRVQFALSNARLHESGTSGDTLYSAGVITKATYSSRSWDKLVEITDIDASLAYFSARYAQDRLFGFYDYMIAGGAEFVNPGDARTSVGPDRVLGSPNDAFLKDLGGADVYLGGRGRDTLSYDEWFWRAAGAIDGVRADLDEGKIRGPDGFIDLVSGIDELRGSFLDDLLRGGAANERFAGMQGDDTINGRGGFDLVYFYRDANQGGGDRVVVNLQKGQASDGFGGFDQLLRIEGAIGTRQGDIFLDNGDSNYFSGLDGDDRFRLRKGDDVARGGGGDDLFRFVGTKFGRDTIEDFSDGDLIEIISADQFSDLTLRQRGDHLVVRFTDKAAIVLENTDAADISASDFLF